MLNFTKRKGKREEGQAMIEFCLVLPVLLLLIGLVIEYGWMFYNQIGIENSARNAARVACVEYRDVCVCTKNGAPFLDKLDASGGATAVAGRSFYLTDYFTPSGTFVGEVAGPGADDNDITDEEKDILQEVVNSMPNSLYKNQYKNGSVDQRAKILVTIRYTYDDDFDKGANNTLGTQFEIKNRSKGDVKVQVSATYKPISPFVAWGDGQNPTSRYRTLNSQSVYKVEKLETTE